MNDLAEATKCALGHHDIAAGFSVSQLPRTFSNFHYSIVKASLVYDLHHNE